VPQSRFLELYFCKYSSTSFLLIAHSAWYRCVEQRVQEMGGARFAILRALILVEASGQDDTLAHRQHRDAAWVSEGAVGLECTAQCNEHNTAALLGNLNFLASSHVRRFWLRSLAPSPEFPWSREIPTKCPGRSADNLTKRDAERARMRVAQCEADIGD